MSQTLPPSDAPYPAFIERDLPTLVSNVVPPTREGVLNLRSARLILDSWKKRRVLGEVVDKVLDDLEQRALKGFEYVAFLQGGLVTPLLSLEVGLMIEMRAKAVVRSDPTHMLSQGTI